VNLILAIYKNETDNIIHKRSNKSYKIFSLKNKIFNTPKYIFERASYDFITVMLRATRDSIETLLLLNQAGY